MLETLRNALTGEIISVTHTADSCRITIELKGTPADTASLMKQRLVELGFVKGTHVRAGRHGERTDRTVWYGSVSRAMLSMGTSSG